MIIYQSTSEQFIQDVRLNKLTDKIVNSFKEIIGKNPSYSERVSFQNSLPRIRDIIEIAELKNIIIAIEYQIPYNNKRIDCLLFGKSNDENEHVVLIELKQWSEVTPIDKEGNFVETYTGGGNRKVAHPSQQVEGYHNYLMSFVQEFEVTQPLILFSCSYCHNYSKKEKEGLFAPIYKNILNQYPVYTKADTELIALKIKKLLKSGDGLEIFNRFLRSKIKPSIKLLDNVANIIKNETVFSLLDE